MHILAGDIGGTNSRLIFAGISDGVRQVVAEKSYTSANFDGLIEVIDHFLSDHKIATDIDAACFAIAGPVESGVAAVTNLPWVISEQQLAEVLSTPRIRLLNDLAAAAYGVAELYPDDMLLLQQGSSSEQEPKHADAVVVAAGTGLGAAHRVWLEDHYRVFSSEVGHTGFAPETIQQTGLLAWLQKKNSHVSLEDILSGRGLATIYRFLEETSPLVESVEVNNAMLESDPAQVITQQALAGKDELCVSTLEMFVDIYGAAAGDIVLQHYPVTELYIAGGIAPKIKDKILERRFLDAFTDKGLMSSNMKKLTVKLVMQEKVGLLGALSLAGSSLV